MCINFIYVQVLEKGKRSHAQVIAKSTGLKSLVRSVGRRRFFSIARKAMCNSAIRAHALRLLAADIQREMKEMSRVNTGTCMHISSPACTCIYIWPCFYM